MVVHIFRRRRFSMEPLRSIINLYAIFLKKFQMDQMKTTGTWKNQKDGFNLQQEKGLWLVFIVSKYFGLLQQR